MELNKTFLKNMQNLLGGGYEKYIESLSEKPKKAFRLNSGLERGFEEMFLYPHKKIEGLCGCYSLLSDEKIGNTLSHHLGQIYSQEPSSMLAAEALEVNEGESVIDLCSAPGGKGSQILDKNKTGVVVLNEVIRSRANVLMSNIERQGFKNAIIVSLSPSELSSRLGGFFDKVLVDAPCSGEGMFRKEPETIGEWNEGLPEFNHKRQLEILASADKLLKQGGTLVYSTCTFNSVENEQTVLEFADRFGYEIVSLPDNVLRYVSKGFKIGGDERALKFGRCFPQDGFGEGQFIAKLIKISNNNSLFCAKARKNDFVLNKNELKNAKELEKELFGCEKFNFYKVKNSIFIYDGEPFFLENILMMGVCFAKLENGRMAVHHQLFRAYGDKMKNRLDLKIDDPRVKEYIYGNEIETSLSGYVAVLVDGYPLGGGKASGGKLKNYYPKGLRATLKS